MLITPFSPGDIRLSPMSATVHPQLVVILVMYTGLLLVLTKTYSTLKGELSSYITPKSCITASKRNTLSPSGIRRGDMSESSASRDTSLFSCALDTAQPASSNNEMRDRIPDFIVQRYYIQPLLLAPLRTVTCIVCTLPPTVTLMVVKPSATPVTVMRLPLTVHLATPVSATVAL